MQNLGFEYGEALMSQTLTPLVTRRLALAAGVAGLLVALLAPLVAQSKTSVSNRPETPFKLATFEVQGRTRLGMTSGRESGDKPSGLSNRLVDISAANAYVAKQAGLPAVAIPGDMLALIEQYDRLAPRLYEIANYLKTANVDSLPFAFDAKAATFKPPITYPWNFLNIAANYRAHAAGMGAATPAAPAGGRAGFNAAALADIVPERDGPIVFAKSPRSCIIATGEPFYIPEGNQRIDWEGELGIIIGKPAFNVTRERAHDYVFGYSIVNDISDPGTNWFDGKSIDRGGPFGPYIVPKEFINASNLRIVTRVNGVVKQDQPTSDMIWGEAHQIAYISMNMTLYPGDLISTGTPSGTGAERNEFLKPGDVVTIDIEGIGTLTTPIKAASEQRGTR
jgi:2-keto-4-pentenoate hydratase/2-oxohepta-3-ene-1,7-dioic acid hydratase in catechol pathway